MNICTSGAYLYLHDGHKEIIKYTLDLASANDYVYIGVNSQDYLKIKHRDVIDNLNPSALTRYLLASSDDKRFADVQKYVNSLETNAASVIVICTDSLLYEIPSRKTVWVVAEQYRHMQFQEGKVADYVVLTPRTKVPENKGSRTLIGR